MKVQNISILGGLCGGSTYYWIHHFSRGTIDIDLWTKCKFGHYFFYFFTTYFTALLVIISVEKFIALYFPFKSKIICTVLIAKRVSLVTGIIFAVFNAQFIIIIDAVMSTSDQGICYYLHAPESYIDTLV